MRRRSPMHAPRSQRLQRRRRPTTNVVSRCCRIWMPAGRRSCERLHESVRRGQDVREEHARHREPDRRSVRHDDRREGRRQGSAGRRREPQLVPSQPRPEVRRPRDREGSGVHGDSRPARSSSSIIYPADMQAKRDVLQGPRGAQGRPRRSWGTSMSCAAAATNSRPCPTTSLTKIR